MNNDTWMLGGHEFHSRFILGSGKYSLNLIEAAVKDAGAEIITLAVRRANTREHENILDYIPDHVTLLPQYQRRENCGRSSPYRAAGQRAWLRRFRKGGDYAGFQVSSAGQSGDH